MICVKSTFLLKEQTSYLILKNYTQTFTNGSIGIMFLALLTMLENKGEIKRETSPLGLGFESHPAVGLTQGCLYK